MARAVVASVCKLLRGTTSEALPVVAQKGGLGGGQVCACRPTRKGSARRVFPPQQNTPAAGLHIIRRVGTSFDGTSRAAFFSSSSSPRRLTPNAYCVTRFRSGSIGFAAYVVM